MKTGTPQPQRDEVPEREDRTRVEDMLFVGTHGHVVAVDKRDGRTVWDTSLPGTGFGVVAIVVEDGWLYCGSGGHVFALEPLDGSIMWRNVLPGLGTGLTYLVTASSSGTERVMTMLADAVRQQQAAQSSGTP